MSDINQFLEQVSNKRIWNHKASEFNNVKMFIEENHIKIGTFAVPNKYVYATYCEQNRPPMSRRRMMAYFNTFFKRVNSGAKFFYRLDPTPFNIPEGYTIWKDFVQQTFQYKKTRHYNIKSTPEGWMVFLDMPNDGGRKIFGFYALQSRAAHVADRVAWFYFGPKYLKFNYPKKSKLIKEDDELLGFLQLKKEAMDDPSKKESI